MRSLSKKTIAEFQQTVRHQGKFQYRDLPWRRPEIEGNFDPFKILVSEIMLQQTQVSRVVPKYEEFLKQFPKIETLAGALLGEVLQVWSGLGYNRRAKFLWQAARQVVQDFDKHIPSDIQQLQSLPGVGLNTAGAVSVYAFNQPAVFIETNIRTVFIHHFFKDAVKVSDKDIAQLLGQTLDTTSPRIFYWALMDYGTFLKSTQGNLSRNSAQYAKQSPFHGSRRQLRGQVIRLLTRHAQSQKELSGQISDERLGKVLSELEKEGLIFKLDSLYRIL